ncbi:DNA-3-methyladenine glycosylase family protein [Arthrobacter sp. VKM Ac-2550]|uniref:DNA-3-methyladenine glycosylase family protein n=1 Tax=Crystallibacter permensis TaxID=1938888 RepID=UPI0022273C24|nr:3-methyladenine DNA glycosylase [Arthrobacter sp. VKM Ac-2550]MCW2132183.1 3-methyladenine DNA glycosylase/8-oxoguanine DNA glycosylase [Arthrobacter sp. VKM Ac-2550]
MPSTFAATAAPTADAAATVELPAGYDLRGTLGIIPRGKQDPTFQTTHDGVWLAFATAQGPVTLRLASEDTGPNAGADPTVIRVLAWGPGAETALPGLPALLGADDDWTAFDRTAFQATLPKLVAEPRRRYRGLRLPSTGRILDALVPVVLEQKITTIEARYSWRYLVSKYGTPAPGPAPAGLKVAPSAAQWRRIPSWDWHRAGVDAKRSATILRACNVASGLERLATLAPGPELTAKLCSVPGIGPWSAAEIAQRTHGDPDSVSVGDFHLAAFVGYALTGKKTDDAGMLALLEPWRGHRQRVVRMLYLSGFRKPAFGPRLAPQDHRFH